MCSLTLSTKAFADVPYFASMSLFIEPVLTPILIGICFSLHSSTTFLTFSSEPILPGFNLTALAPELIDSIASL